jgi:hypothetical protein
MPITSDSASKAYKSASKERSVSGVTPVTEANAEKAQAAGNRVKVTAAKLHFDSEHGTHRAVGDSWETSRQRANELQVNGLIDRLDGKPGPKAEEWPGQHSGAPEPGKQTNEPPAEPDANGVISPPPGEGVPDDVGGPMMVVENPDSLIPSTPPFVERSGGGWKGRRNRTR